MVRCFKNIFKNDSGREFRRGRGRNYSWNTIILKWTPSVEPLSLYSITHLPLLFPASDCYNVFMSKEHESPVGSRRERESGIQRGRGIELRLVPLPCCLATVNGNEWLSLHRNDQWPSRCDFIGSRQALWVSSERGLGQPQVSTWREYAWGGKFEKDWFV